MAYSNYGAYVWKNGINMIKKCCDVGYAYKKHGNIYKWIKHEDEEEEHVGGHAVIPIGNNILLVFYKKSLSIYWGNDNGSITSEYIDVDEKIFKHASFKKNGLEIMGYELNTFIQFYEIKYKHEIWCVVIGSAFGNGWDDRHVSKLLKKKIKFANGYYVDLNDYELDKAVRKDDIHSERYALWNYGIIPFLKRPDYWSFEEVKKRLKNLYYLH